MTSAQKRRWWVPAIAAAVAVIAAVVFWKPLVGWFSGESVAAPEQTPSRQSAGTPGVAGFSDALVTSLKKSQDVYEQLRATLASDRLEEAKGVAKLLAGALDEAKTSTSGMAPGFADAVANASKSSQQVANAASLEEARKAFGVLSSVMLELAAHDPRLQSGWHVFECPMVQGEHNRWMQRSEKIENPFMGQQMAACGTEKEFESHPPTAQADDGGVAYYTCSMHPSVRQHSPGNCPICGMTLQPVTNQSLKSGEVRLDEGQRKLIGLKTGKVERAPLRVVVHALGKVSVDETKLTDVTLRVKGWIHELKVDQTGQPVRKGQVLFTLYSPELYAAEQEYLLALQSKTAGSDLAAASKAKLELWGLSGAQIARVKASGKPIENMPFLAPASGYVLEKNVVEGAAVDAGQKLYRIAALDHVWIDAEVYEGDLPHVKVGETATVSLPYQPGKTFTGKVTYVYPYLQGSTRTGKVRVELANPDLALKPDMFADLTMEQPATEERLQVSASAVIYTGPRRIVFVDKGDGRLVPRDVKLGVRAGDNFEVLEGLEEGDTVVTSGNFLVAAESRLKSAAEFWSEDGQ